MTKREAEQVMAVLRSAYPDAKMSPPTVAVYARSLADFTADEARRAVNVAVTTEARLPSIARLREIVFEERLQLLEDHEAWERVRRNVFHRTPFRRCSACAGLGEQGEQTCDVCRGVGEVPVEQPPSLDPVTRRALDFVGGVYAVRCADRPEILRAQFLKAYVHFRSSAIREANLVSLGVLQPAAGQLAVEA